MNHLAHFYLSGQDEDIIIGNFIADFISNKEMPQYTEGVQRGIYLHREIDTFTDTHPIVKKSTKRLHPFHHKYSPVIVDIYYDFLLAKNWESFTPHTAWAGMTIREFTHAMYEHLKHRKQDLPEKLRSRIDRMIADDWLMSYTTYEGLKEAFIRIERYAAFPGNFQEAPHHLEEFITEFNQEFLLFFPDLIDCVRNYWT